MKWGEYSSDVQFILQRSDTPKTVTPDQALKNPASTPPQVNESPKKAKSAFDQPTMDEKLPSLPLVESNSIKNIQPESVKANEPRRTDLIGIVKGMEMKLYSRKSKTFKISSFRCSTYNDAKFNKDITTTVSMLINNGNINNDSERFC